MLVIVSETDELAQVKYEEDLSFGGLESSLALLNRFTDDEDFCFFWTRCNPEHDRGVRRFLEVRGLNGLKPGLQKNCLSAGLIPKPLAQGRQLSIYWNVGLNRAKWMSSICCVAWCYDQMAFPRVEETGYLLGRLCCTTGDNTRAVIGR